MSSDLKLWRINCLTDQTRRQSTRTERTVGEARTLRDKSPRVGASASLARVALDPFALEDDADGFPVLDRLIAFSRRLVLPVLRGREKLKVVGREHRLQKRGRFDGARLVDDDFHGAAEYARVVHRRRRHPPRQLLTDH